MMEYPVISVLGCTGSVGLQALDVARRCRIKVSALSANKSVSETEALAREFGVSAVAMADERSAKDLKIRLADTKIKIYSGADGICQMIADDKESETVVNAVIGEAGLAPTLAVLKSGKRLALANKESLVCAGDIVMQTAKEYHTEILPVDSEHSAIFQSLRAGKQSEIKKILLTASGGPFYGYTKERLKDITVEKALSHPTWKMGAKITVDSATLMNKGFEVIEAVHLFGVTPERVEVLIHRESVLHSAVEFVDNAVIGQFSVPDMRLCVQYALTHPNRSEGVIEELNFTKLSQLTFAKPDTETFPLLALAGDCIQKGGALPCVLNASNEVAVAHFLKKELSFLGITELVSATVGELQSARNGKTLEEIFAYDRLAREKAEALYRKGEIV